MSDTKVTIRTNNQPRNLLCWEDLTAKEQKWFDFLKTEQDRQDAEFFRYLGTTYYLGNFMRTAMEGWDGAEGDSYFSGTLVKFTEGNESVIVGRYYC